ncbi:MAG TPA: HAMP domain-containing sensor histidine kinase [Prolixibacteraceae bacterium]|nr:HAMP domain-containing sensor histidine kinase [Prolixibacteraceae bacterium]
MNIKTKLSIRFTILVLSILLFFSILVYYFSYTSHRTKFRENLIIQAQNTAILLINVVEVDSVLLNKIQETTRLLEGQEIVITNSARDIIYQYRIHDLNEGFVQSHSADKSPMYFFTLGNKVGVSYRHELKRQVYRVFVLAFDRQGYENLRELKRILFWSILFSTWICISASYWFSRLAMKPIAQIVTEVQGINYTKLNKRLKEGKGKDEIEQLAVTFNQLLSRLEQVFRSQDQFVSNASHELRTPLAVMMAETDYILNRESTKEELNAHIKGMNRDLQKLNRLISGLLELTQLENETQVVFSEIRMDELLLEVIRLNKVKFPDRKIIPVFHYPETENDLIINGNTGLLTTVFMNLIENACKFSTGEVEVSLYPVPGMLSISVRDSGIGIPEGEIRDVFKPFKRGSNAKQIAGSGIGLSLVARIAELHNADIEVNSSAGQGTTFRMHFKKRDEK